MHLIIGNKNYSSWSMRPWVLLKAFGIPFEERKLRFDFAPGSDFYRELARYTPTGKVPVLIEDEGFAVWDTLAIAEHIAERHPELPIWPRDARQRSRARSICAEMHAGFGALRQNCPMNIEASLPEVGTRLLAEQPQVRADLARIDAIWSEQLAASGGPFLFGEFGAIDAYFAPVVMRIHSYGLPLSPASAAYAQRVRQAPGVADWISDALAEQDFLDCEEPYRSART
ncbi:glutathione S-transferase family protein [Paucibacter sp. XJ19-41]|uniref:glutathione S-transferase family protein n=1 Tax=Paucibacter sp. XJ19-41 TaxID=2927824 RepID=UPI00234AE10A|nr:glutathione S-transferase family protein [Paucibacter sp. XJ19-41]MDC6169561.1 glutathione S-transferase family protein [Paucibacter sp. XJ19-41]